MPNYGQSKQHLTLSLFLNKRGLGGSLLLDGSVSDIINTDLLRALNISMVTSTDRAMVVG